MTAFQSMLDALFADPNMAVSVIYTPAVGSPVTVRGMWSQPDQIDPGFQTGRVTTVRRLEIRVSELPTRPAKGDMVTIGVTTYRVDQVSQEDDDRLLWFLSLRP